MNIDLSKVPRTAGFSAPRLQVTAEAAPGSDIGAFRTVCEFSHMSYDDPIVYPNQPGRSHLHTFFGNTGLTAATTAESLRTTGNSTCRGGTVNRSAYWVPAMIDTGTNAPVTPRTAIIYYKQGYEISPSSAIHAIPPGLRMISGDAGNASPTGGPYGYACHGATGELLRSGAQIPNCPAGTTEFLAWIVFPQCWDGKNLDSPDHKSHMSGPAQLPSAPFTKFCPPSHPVALPNIAFNVLYPVGPGGTSKWRLASDMYDASIPSGYSMHGDWFNGWDETISDSWAKNCVQAQKDCFAHLLGDGRFIF